MTKQKRTIWTVVCAVVLAVMLSLGCADEEGGGAQAPEGEDEKTVCTSNLCEADMAMEDACEAFLAACIPNEPDEECIGAAYFFCRFGDLD
jgi:hypothetical protein